MEKYQNLVAWMVDNSIELSSSLKVQRSELGGYGVFSVKKIARDSVLLSVDKQHVLSPATCGIANLLEEYDLDGMIGLTVAYMFERAQGEKSPWYTYLQIIDEEPSITTLPRFWTEEEQSWLVGTEIEFMGGLDETEVSEVYADMIKPFIDSYSDLFASKPIYNTYEGYKNSLMAVCSRAFEVDGFRGLSLVPGACIFNHSDNEDVHFETNAAVCMHCGAHDYCEHEAEEDIEKAMAEAEIQENDVNSESENDSDSDSEMEDGIPELVAGDEENDFESDNDSDEEDEKDTCDIRTIQSIGPGKEIFNSYGNFPNGVLLSRYGFAIWDNTNETVSMAQEIIGSITTEDLKTRLKWWKKYYYKCIFGIHPEEYDDEAHGEDVPPPDSLSWQETAEILSHGEPTEGLRILLNILSMSSKKFMLMSVRAAKNNNFSAVPTGRDGSRLWKELVKQRAARYQDGNMSSKEYQRVLKDLPCGDENARKRLALTVRGTEKLVLERALKFKY